jgi:integrase/recombinase XerD
VVEASLQSSPAQDGAVHSLRTGVIGRIPVAARGQESGLGTLVAEWLVGFSSPHTRRAYQADLTRWLEWCATSRLDPVTQVRRPHIDAWLRAAEVTGVAVATRARRLATVSSWYAWLVAEEHTARNPAAAVRRPQVDVDASRTVGLTRDQAAALLAAADADTRPSALRTRALLRLLLANALRVGELVALTTDDLGHARGHRTLRIRGKGGKTATVPIAPATAAAIEAYLASREDLRPLPVAAAAAGAGPAVAPLFATSTGKALDQAAVWRVLRRLAREAGPDVAEVAEKLSPHSLRHTAITAALDAGVSLRDAQDYARHADPRTTRRYDRARYSLDRHATYAVSAYLEDGTTTTEEVTD